MPRPRRPGRREGGGRIRGGGLRTWGRLLGGHTAEAGSLLRHSLRPGTEGPTSESFDGPDPRAWSNRGNGGTAIWRPDTCVGTRASPHGLVFCLPGKACACSDRGSHLFFSHHQPSRLDLAVYRYLVLRIGGAGLFFFLPSTPRWDNLVMVSW